MSTTDSPRIYVHKRSSYADAVVIPRTTAQNKHLSWAARGLLTYCLSLPADWELRENHLIGESPGGRDHLRSIVRELEAAGYLQRSVKRTKKGVMCGVIWQVWDTPQTAQPSTGKPSMDAPLTDYPATGKPSVGKTQSQPVDCPSPGFPSVDPPSTGYPSPENPSTYKELHRNKQQPLENPLPLFAEAEPKPAKPRAKPKPTGDPYAGKILPPNAVPFDLLELQDLLPEWWAVKKGVRSEAVFNRVCKTLRSWPAATRVTAVENAIASGWANVYEPRTPSAAPSGLWNGHQGRMSEAEKALAFLAARDAAQQAHTANYPT